MFLGSAIRNVARFLSECASVQPRHFQSSVYHVGSLKMTVSDLTMLRGDAQAIAGLAEALNKGRESRREKR